MERRAKRWGCWLAAAIVCAAVATPVARAQSAGTLERRGATAESKGDYDTAYEDFRKAYERHPKNLSYKTHCERLRFMAAAQHVDQGRKLRAMGDPAAALAQYMRALQIDPSNQAAQQEIDETRRQQMSQPAPGEGGGSQAVSPEVQGLRNLASISSPVDLKPVSHEPITLHMVEDAKTIFTAIGKAAGLNVIFDPDYNSKRITVDMNNVSLYDALRIVGTLAGTFWKPVTADTIFVAQNTRTKRTDLDNLAVQTFYLTNAAQQNDANEVTTALRNLLDPSVKVYLVPSQNAIVMRATTDQLLLAQKIINDLDRARAEVVVDVAVLEVNKDKLRNLGITLPQSFGVALQPLGGSSSTSSTSSTTTTTTGTSTTSSSGLTLNSLGNLNANNFAITVNAATANLLLSDSDTRVLQNPRIRATDGQRATLKIGSKIPVATGSYSAGTAATTVSLGVQTQFQYLDVGVNIDITPTVHFDRQISLKVKVEVSTQSGSTTISGVTEPIISQRVVEQEVQLREGEPSILAGLLEHQDNKSIGGLPGLGEIPLLKYLFSTTNKEVAQDEVVFLLIPHIVREQTLSPLNTRAIDTGTNQEIELRHDEKPDESLLPPAALNLPPVNRNMTAASAANAAVAGMEQQAKNAGQAAQTALDAMQPAANTPQVTLSFAQAEMTQAVGTSLTMTVNVANAQDLSGVPMEVQYDPAHLQLVNVDAGDLLGRDGQAVALVHRDDGKGNVSITESRPPGTTGVNGQGPLCTLSFKALSAGNTTVSIVKAAAKNSAQASQPAQGSRAIVHLKP